jgi:hypothetical protein
MFYLDARHRLRICREGVTVAGVNLAELEERRGIGPAALLRCKVVQPDEDLRQSQITRVKEGSTCRESGFFNPGVIVVCDRIDNRLVWDSALPAYVFCRSSKLELAEL